MMTVQRTTLFSNIPNALSVYRIIAAPILLGLVLLDKLDIFKWLLIISLITDILDGFIARRFNLETALGARLDSIGDMGTFLVAIVGLFKFQPEFLTAYKIQILVLLSFYFLQRVLAFLRFRAIISFHTYLARINGYMQGIFFTTLFLFEFKVWIFYPTLLVGLLAYTEEMIIILLLDELQSNLKGLYWVMKSRSPR